jgi:hypothetical protein
MHFNIKTKMLLEMTKICIVSTQNVATLALGSQLRQGLARVHAKKEAWECG